MQQELFSESDVSKNRLRGSLGYLFFFVPLVFCPDSRFGRYCANQGLIYLITVALLEIMQRVLGYVPLLGWILRGILWLLTLAITILAIYRFYVAFTQGEAKPLPFVGNYRIIK